LVGAKEYVHSLFYLGDKHIFLIWSRLLKGVLRVAYPVHYLNQFDLVDFILHTDTLLKTIPEARIEEFEKKIRSKIVDQQQYVQASKNETVPPEIPVPTSENYQQFTHLKENFILYPARISVRKGQLLFAKKIDAKLIKKHNLTIVFAGSVGDKKYNADAIAILKHKGIPFKMAGFLSPDEMVDYYIRAKLTGIIILI